MFELRSKTKWYCPPGKWFYGPTPLPSGISWTSDPPLPTPLEFPIPSMVGVWIFSGTTHFNPKFWKFWLVDQMDGPFRFGLTGIFMTSSEGCPLWLVWSFWSVRPKCPSPFDKIVVPSTALLYPAYKNNNMLWLGLGLCNQNVLFHWACGINEISNWNFCWMELSIPGLPFPTLRINIHPGIISATIVLKIW